MKRIAVWVIAMTVVLSFAMPRVTFASYSLTGDFVADSSEYKYSIPVPKDWAYMQFKHTTLKGEKAEEVIITQQGDLVSRPAKWFDWTVGSASAVFGLNPRIVQKLSNEQLVDFYIDQSYNDLIDYTVTKTEVKNRSDYKSYCIESNNLVPGPYRVMNSECFIFKNDFVYHWSYSYFTSHANYAATLQSVADTFKIF